VAAALNIFSLRQLGFANATSDGIDAGQAKGIDKSTLTVAAPRRYRNREHLRYVAQQA
jgi:hypothetical protein